MGDLTVRRSVVLLALAVALSSASPALATGPGKNGRLLLDSFRPSSAHSGPPRMEWLAPDGSARTVLREGAVGQATLAPGGAGLVATSFFPDGRTEVRRFEVDARGDGVPLAEGSRPHWSPDGSTIAFFDRSDDLSVVAAAGGTPRKLLVGEAGRVFFAGWSPDGRRIAFIVESYGSAGHAQRLETMAVDGTDRRPVPLDASPFAVDWSPDGRRFVGSFALADGTFGIGTVSVCGGTPKIVVPDEPVDQILWSPDGRKIAWARQFGPVDQGEISVANADGTGAARLTTTTDRWEYLSDWERLEPTAAPVDTDADGRPDASDPEPTVAGTCTEPGPPAEQPEARPDPPAAPAPIVPVAPPSPAVAQARCLGFEVALLDARPAGRAFRLRGFALPAYAGRPVTIVAGGREVGRGVVGRDGGFEVRVTRAERYVARVGGATSRSFKAERRLRLDALRSRAGSVRLTGRVVAPARRRPARMTLTRQPLCGAVAPAGTVRLGRDGRFTVTLGRAGTAGLVVYRLKARLRGGRTFSVPVIVR